MMTMTMTMTTTNRMLSFGGFSKGAGELDKKNQRAGGGGNRASGAFPCRAAAPSLSSEKRRRRKKKKAFFVVAVFFVVVSFCLFHCFFRFPPFSNNKNARRAFFKSINLVGARLCGNDGGTTILANKTTTTTSASSRSFFPSFLFPFTRAPGCLIPPFFQLLHLFIHL